MLSPLRMRQNIWHTLHLASPQEISDGLAFYPGAHGLCRLLSHVSHLSYFPITARHAAGLYAALSPMNTWDTNVANFLDVIRDFSSASVNTTDTNFHKALQIRMGEDPEHVLKGRKVLSFFRSLASPDNWHQPPAIDRHLINCALGLFPTKQDQSRLASNPELYSRIEDVYVDFGHREGIGNRLASIAWFVQRRLSRKGERPIPSHTSSSPLPPIGPVCCQRTMHGHGKDARSGRRMYLCPVCGSTVRPETCWRLVRVPGTPATPTGWTRAWSSEGYKIWPDDKGRTCVTLPLSHPYANSAGYQRLARFLIAEELGYLPRSDEHTHHQNGKLHDDRIDNLELVAVAYHGQIHASAAFVGRGEDGRFKELDPSEIPPAPPGGFVDWPRYGAVLGNAAKREHMHTHDAHERQT